MPFSTDGEELSGEALNSSSPEVTDGSSLSHTTRRRPTGKDTLSTAQSS